MRSDKSLERFIVAHIRAAFAYGMTPSKLYSFQQLALHLQEGRIEEAFPPPIVKIRLRNNGESSIL